jgi:ketosteroid isomerase-like protein
MTSPLDTVQAWASAERSGDAAALEALLHPEFLGVGPFGFLLDREQWMERYRSGDLEHRRFTFTPDTDVRRFGGAAIVVGTQEQEGTHQGRPIDGAFRASLLLDDEPDWRVAAVHLSLRNPPAAPGAPGPEGHPS